MQLFIQLLFGTGASFGFAVLFKCPKKAMFLASLTGGIGWIFYYCGINYFNFNIIGATFLATICISIMSEFLARIKKDAVIVFLIPALLPLVPGSSLYFTLLYFINSDYALAANYAVNTIGAGCAIAVAILLVSSISRYILKFERLVK